MPTKIEKIALEKIYAKHLARYGAPLGQRKCTFRVSKECLKVGAEDLFKGRMCRPCVKQNLRRLYDIRMAKRDIPLKKVGRPRLVATDDESSCDSSDEE